MRHAPGTWLTLLFAGGCQLAGNVAAQPPGPTVPVGLQHIVPPVSGTLPRKVNTLVCSLDPNTALYPKCDDIPVYVYQGINGKCQAYSPYLEVYVRDATPQTRTVTFKLHGLGSNATTGYAFANPGVVVASGRQWVNGSLGPQALSYSLTQAPGAPSLPMGHGLKYDVYVKHASDPCEEADPVIANG